MKLEDKQQKSKSQVKRELLALQELGRELIHLPARTSGQLPLSDALRQALFEAKHLKMSALARQVKHIGKLLRDEDSDAIRVALALARKPHEQEVQVFHKLESWRDKLLAGDDALLDELCGQFVDVDRQRLRQLVRNARKEKALDKPPKSARALFRYLQELVGE